jgi:aldose 1-epimerase
MFFGSYKTLLLVVAAIIAALPSSLAFQIETPSSSQDSSYQPSSSSSSSSSGNAFQKYTISAAGINATFIPYGARLTSLFVSDKNGHPQDIVLGYDDPTDYARDTETVHTYFGAVVGRYANRYVNASVPCFVH